MATGGDALARDAAGRVVFVLGALPGETVMARVTATHASYARATVLEVLEPSPDRAQPPCPFVALGCGGCGWQHVQPAAQARLKADVVRDNLRRLGGVAEPTVEAGPGVGPLYYRTTVRMAVKGGRAGFRRPRSHDVLAVDDCLVAHPLLHRLIDGVDYGAAGEVVLRCGARTGERLALVSPSLRGVDLPEGVIGAGQDDLDAGRPVYFHELVAGARFRISAGSFFQSSPEGAELLVASVSDAIAGAEGGRLVDAYGGVGLFAATLGRERGTTVLETSVPAVSDARTNAPSARVTAVDVAKWRPTPAGAVIADPPRSGLGRRASAVLAATGTPCLALVSCDPASLGRDTALLAEHGFGLEWSRVMDLFPGTPHVETVSRFTR